MEVVGVGMGHNRDKVAQVEGVHILDRVVQVDEVIHVDVE